MKTTTTDTVTITGKELSDGIKLSEVLTKLLGNDSSVKGEVQGRTGIDKWKFEIVSIPASKTEDKFDVEVKLIMTDSSKTSDQDEIVSTRKEAIHLEKGPTTTTP